ncbi:hypothetical protein TrLO_g3961 [Triparma laevis f. longispina]|uniref:RNA-binding protein NOB1 n=1 Tax=Triparma laevis f. longispina TaxID=1714387 RepID=A0A9W7FS29_9STRA|nr:hypothetical protein TrLO_g3961 [Triparma laevis f. longispina]
MASKPPTTATVAQKHRAVVVDSGFIIKKTGLTHLAPAGDTFWAPPEVINNEIRDKAAREHLESLPFTIQQREPSKDAMVAVANFARLTGDYRSLSVVDLKVLALAYDLEIEGCGGAEHLKKEPKKQGKKKKNRRRKKKKKSADDGNGEQQQQKQEKTTEDTEDEPQSNNNQQQQQLQEIQMEVEEVYDDEEEEETTEDNNEEKELTPKSWANLVNPTAASLPTPPTTSATKPWSATTATAPQPPKSGGQFDDASESSNDDSNDDLSDDETYANSDCDISDEECDIYILDEEEVEARKQAVMNGGNVEHFKSGGVEDVDLEKELTLDFPSLSAAATIEYEGSDGDGEEGGSNGEDTEVLNDEEKKKEALKRLAPTPDGKRYNSFKGYEKLMPATGVIIKQNVPRSKMPLTQTPTTKPDDHAAGASRIIGGATNHSSQSAQVDDDGEGWVGGENIDDSQLSFFNSDVSNKKSNDNGNKHFEEGPPLSQRCACATTDFAMQNVLLQMGMKLLSVNGVAITRTKNWVTRCGACFAVYAGETGAGKLFCARCGSDCLQRVAASIDAKTGKLKLHLSAKRRNDTRGTKFSLPKPGKQNRFAGDLLLREDQMMMGAWNMKVKKGSKKVESMFGDDIVDNVGLGDLSKRDDIKVGMGRQNPNQAKQGRERRGKSKKGTEVKACGMRRQWG